MMLAWDRVVPGRDVQAVELWEEMGLYLTRLDAEGRVSSHEFVMLGAHGGHLNGFLLIRGSKDALANVRDTAEFQHMIVRANKSLLGFAVLRAHFGDDVERLMRLYATA
jgi:hypothetical protein